MPKDAISVESLEAEVEIRREAEESALVDLADYLRERATALPPGTPLALTPVWAAKRLEGPPGAIRRNMVGLAASNLLRASSDEGEV
jgi:hypothetical protein